jgi:hypothetical protein
VLVKINDLVRAREVVGLDGPGSAQGGGTWPTL